MGVKKKAKPKKPAAAPAKVDSPHSLPGSELERAQLYLSMAGVMMLALDRRGRISMINLRGCEILGGRADEIQGLNWFDHFIPETRRERIREVFQNIILERQKCSEYQEGPILTLKGEERIIAWHNALIRDESGLIIGTLSSGEDVTEIRQVEEDRVILGRLLDASPASITVHDFNNNFLYANAHTLKIHGMTRTEFLQKGLRGIDDPESFALIQERYDRIRREGHAEFEVTHIRVDGTPIPMMVNARLASWKGQEVVLSVAMDLTELRENEAALLESKQLHQAFINANRDLIFVKDEQFRYIVANDALVEFFGRSREELRSCTDFDLMAPADAQACRKSDNRALAAGATVIVEEAIGNRLFESTKFPLNLKGGRKGIGGIIRDITKRRNSEEEKKRLREQMIQAQKMESVGRLAGGVAHDFNNILSVIMGHAEMAMEKVDPLDPLHADLGEIRRAARRSADLTRQLLAFARRQTIMPRVLDLNETVAGMLKMMARLIGENIDLVWHPGEGIWPVRIDPAQVDQILANLCVNSRDAMPDGGRILINTENLKVDNENLNRRAGFLPGEYVQLTISDDGCGMDRKTLEKVFEPFFTTKGVGEGTGLGLSTVYGIVKQNGGFIHAYSEPGHGTTFSIYLPRHSGVQDDLQSDSGKKKVTGGKETILLVEDEPAILKLGERMLKRLGYHVLAAGTPAAAQNAASEYSGQIDLLLSDVIMPGMNGTDLAVTLKETRPDMKTLFMSGYTADVIAHQGTVNGKVHFMQKPFTLRELATRIREALED